MERLYICDIINNLESEVYLCGFVENFRDNKTMAFIVLKDVTGKIQITIDKDSHPEMQEQLASLTPDSVISVTGVAFKSEYVKLGGIEVFPNTLHVESVAAALPIVRETIPATKKKPAIEQSSVDQRIDYRWIDLRTERNQLIFKMQTAMVQSLRDYLLSVNFLEIHSPKLIGTASESGADVFEVKYFDRKAYLAQSPQFYKQMAMASGFERVYEVGPVFRAEKSYTNRHTTEFTGFDLEFSYITSFTDVMKMEEQLLIHMFKTIKHEYGNRIVDTFGKECEVTVPTIPFPVIKLRDLYHELEKCYGYHVNEWEKGDLTTEAEKLSYKWVKEKHNHEFLFITDYSAEERAFYHMRDENNIPMGYDLMWRGVEITTGAQREHRYERLKSQAAEKGLTNDIEFYLEFFKYGCPPHGGFGLGVDRMTMLMTNTHIKESMFVFRSPKRLNP